MHGTYGERRVKSDEAQGFHFPLLCRAILLFRILRFSFIGNPEAFPYTNYYTNIGTTTKKEILLHINIITSHARVVFRTRQGDT